MTEVHFINAGYGDAALIRSGGENGKGFSMLIDCGGESVGSGGGIFGCRITAAAICKASA